MSMVTIDEGVQRLLEQCDREDADTPHRRFLFTSEIRMLLGVGSEPDRSEPDRTTCQRRVTEVPISAVPGLARPLSAGYLSMTPSVITELDGIDVNHGVEVRVALAAARKRLGKDLVMTASGRRPPRGSIELMIEAVLIICQDCAGLVKDSHGHHLANGVPGCSCPAV